MSLKLTNKQYELLNNIIAKNELYDKSYDQLFIELIPFAFKVINKNNFYGTNFNLENEDFLTDAFKAYTSIIESIQRNEFGCEKFLWMYGRKIRERVRAIASKMSTNGHKILNVASSDTTTKDYLTTWNYHFDNTNFNNIILDLESFLKDNPMFSEIVNLRIKGLTLKEISEHLDLPINHIVKKLSLFKEKISILLN